MAFRTMVVISVALTFAGLSSAADAHYDSTEPAAVGKPIRSVKDAQAGPPVIRSIDPWKLLEMALSPAYAASSSVSITLSGGYRLITGNGLPNHPTGDFPNSGNPNTISEQRYSFRVPAQPQETGTTARLGMNLFGVAVNGVPFDPGAAEWWNNDPSSGWQYEAMALGPRLGLDGNNAHVQPNGAYHYHGIPSGLINRLAAAPKPVLLGYAADGFPIYGPFGHSQATNPQSRLTKLKSSYRLKGGERPDGPGGAYDGLFVRDYEYVAGLADLDECNGRFGVTSEYPQGTYHYVITDTYPFIPRAYKGTPDPSFRKGPPGGRPGFGRPRRPGFGPPGMGGPPPGGPGFGPRPDFGPPPDGY